jgi:5-hydroxyisourate hydrolase-like protein (transthyretin family)
MYKKYIFIVIFLSCCSLAYPHNNVVIQDTAGFSVLGTVVDSKNATPVENAEIDIVDTKRSKLITHSITNKDGRFVVTAYKEGEYTLFVSMMGYSKHIQNIFLNEKQKTLDLGVIKLDQGISLSEITVTAEAPLLTYEVNKIVYDVSRDPDRFKISMLKMMEKLPFTRVNASGKIEHKSPSTSYLILINGQEYRLITASRQYPMSFIKAEYIKKIEIISPPPPEHEGCDAVINIILSKPLPDGYATEFNLTALTDNSFDFSPGIVSKVRKIIFSLDYSFKTSDPPPLKQNYYRENYLSDNYRYTYKTGSGYSYATAQSLELGASRVFNNRSYISLSLSTDWKNSISSVQNYTTNKNILEQVSGDFSGVSNNKQITYPKLNLGFKYVWFQKENKGHLQIRYNIKNSHYDKNEGINNRWIVPSDSIMTQNDNESTEFMQHNLTVSMFRKLNKNSQINGSASYLYRDYGNDSYYSLNSGLGNSLEKNGLTYAQQVSEVFAAYSHNTRKVGLNAGISLNNVSNSGKYKNNSYYSDLSYRELVLLPRLSLSFYFANRNSINILYFTSASRPGIGLLNPYIDKKDPLNIVTGNPELKSEYSNSFTIRHLYMVKNKLSMTLAINSVFTKNSIEKITLTNSDNVNVTTYDNLGIKNTTGLSLGVSYTFLKHNSLNTSMEINRNYYKGLDIKNSNTTFDLSAMITSSLWNGSDMAFGFSFRNNPVYVQSIRANINHSIYLSLSQSIIKERLYCGIYIKDPLKNRKTIINEMRTDNYYIKEENQEPGRVIKFWVRFTIGNFKERVKAVEGAYSDDIKTL